MNNHIFQIWTIKQINGIANTIKEEKNKESISYGIDSWIDKEKTIPIEVKMIKNIGIDFIRIFADKIREKNLFKGVFIGLEKLTSGAINRISLLKEKEEIDIVFINFDDLFDRKRLIEKGIIKQTGEIRDHI